MMSRVAPASADRWMMALALPVLLFIGGCDRQAEAPPTASVTPTTSPATALPPVHDLWNLSGEPPHLVAHYVPWFTITRSFTDDARTWDHWQYGGPGYEHDPEKRLPDGRRDIASVQYPLIGPYNSWSPTVVRYHLRTAQAAGIQAFIVDWYGPGSDSDARIPLLLEEAEKVGMRIAICYEEKINFPPYRTPATRATMIESVVVDLTYIVERYTSHPAYLTRDGRPLICQFNSWGSTGFGPKYLTSMEWRAVFPRLPRPVVYARQNVDDGYHPLVAGAYTWWVEDESHIEKLGHQAVELRRRGELMFFMGTVYAGFDDTGVGGWGGGPRTSAERGPHVIARSLGIALAGAPELVQVVTWNDFNEGTAIEPTRDTGYDYLDALESEWARLTGRPVDLADNREPLQEYFDTCTPSERAELPPPPLDPWLKGP